MIQDTLFWVEHILSIATILQTIELFQLRTIWSDRGIWTWNSLRRQFSIPIFGLFFSENGFGMVLILRLIAALMIWIYPFHIWNALIFLTTWMISVRFRGYFNGGSDSMTIVVSLGIWLSRFFQFHPIYWKLGIAYIAIQLTLSYWIAGLVKLANPAWRSGTAMPAFFKTPRYDSPPKWIHGFFDHPQKSQLTSWALMAFEITFPLAWLSPDTCIFYCSIAFIFHVLNFWIFGLNRFVFAWLSAYPALYFWSQARH